MNSNNNQDKMDFTSKTGFESTFTFDQEYLDPLKLPHPNETSRFFDILDSPENSENEENTLVKDSSTTLTQVQEVEEGK